MPPASYYGVSSVEEVVTIIYGLLGTKQGYEYVLLCPTPGHVEARPSCAINLDSGYWNCFSCGAGGDIVGLGVVVLDRPVDEVVELLRPHSPDAVLATIHRRITNNFAHNRARRAPQVDLPQYEPIMMHPDLERRLFTADTVERWGLCWAPAATLAGQRGEFTIRSSIAIPVRDAAGRLLAWCYRRTDASPAWQPRYLYTPGAQISELWYGLQYHNPNATRTVTVVEGALDAMWLDQCGFPALGLLGSSMGQVKIMWLQNYEMFYTLPDYDNGGAQWQRRVTGMLGRRLAIRLCQYRPWMSKKTPDGSGTYRSAADPEEVRPVDLEIMHATAPLYLRTLIDAR
jgi:hypothetical protein